MSNIDSSINKTIGKYRWTICALLFFATTINYLDRQVISLLKPALEKNFNWSELDYSNIINAFLFAYGLGLIGFGRIIDKIGTKLGYALSLTIWSLAEIAHIFARSIFGFASARAVLGISEAGNFPAAIKTVAEWFPKKERALATGIFNSGANIGAIAAPIVVLWINSVWGWQSAFILTGIVGFIWLILWFIYYEVPAKHEHLTKTEYDFIYSDAEEIKDDRETVSWTKLLRFRQTWAFVIGKFMTDPIWWFYLFWLPSFLGKEYGMTGTKGSFPIALVYAMACFGSIGGGWLSSFLIKEGWKIYKARSTSMLIFAICVIPVFTAQTLGNINPWLTVLIIGVAASAHQAWSANLFTIASDMFPKKALGSIIGIGGMAGVTGGILIAHLTGTLLNHYKILGHIEIAYYIMFLICGLTYIIAWAMINLLAPKMEQVEI